MQTQTQVKNVQVTAVPRFMNINVDRSVAGAMMWHFEDNDAKKENLALRALVGSLKTELDTVKKGAAQDATDKSALLVAQQSLAYERRVTTELEEMHRQASENVRTLRDELRVAHELASKESILSTQIKIEEVLKQAGWKREMGEVLDQTVRRALTDNSEKMHAMQQDNHSLRSHVSFLEMMWNQFSSQPQTQGAAPELQFGSLETFMDWSTPSAPADTSITQLDQLGSLNSTSIADSLEASLFNSIAALDGGVLPPLDNWMLPDSAPSLSTTVNSVEMEGASVQ
ncbi:hypothetical protein BKA62DRAFT_719898 [Auriculariales sp. MPI-PUGE-AT-0066]|nr:hypothetical protein BKA62DRAFT_719898 [Auriculariales sp. MPI-PUGE-AT-0066]